MRVVRAATGGTVLAIAIAVWAVSAPAPKRAGAKMPPGEAPPNVVVLMTDDQTVESLRAMPHTRRLLAEEGVEFTNSLASNPICCPSRATFLTGRYAHNHGVLRNSAPNGGYAQLDGSQTLPVWLREAGYYTAHIGKYLNGYGRAVQNEIPPGWDEWRGSVDPTTYSMHGFMLNEQGTLTTYGDPDVADPATYQTDVYAQKAVDVIGRRAPRDRPLFLSVAPLAPHSENDLGEDDPPDATPGPRAAPRHEAAFAAEGLPQPPSYNEADVSDKPAAIQARGPIGQNAAATIEARYRDRLESLLAVDEMVAALVTALRRAGELDSTFFVFTADNGFFHGEHRVRSGKQLPYEESIQVPLIMRGPRIPAGGVRRQPVANIDLAATILAVAGAQGSTPLDGMSLLALARDARFDPGRAILIENWCGPNESCFDPMIPRYQGVRTDRYAYIEYPTGEAELYDLELDPFQLDSRHADPAYAQPRDALSMLLGQMRACADEDCRAVPRVKLDLDYERRRRRGEKCSASGITVTPKGPDADEAIAVEAFVERTPTGEDNEAPLRVRVSPKEIHRRFTSVRANFTMLDGRAVSVHVAVPRPC